MYGFISKLLVSNRSNAYSIVTKNNLGVRNEFNDSNEASDSVRPLTGQVAANRFDQTPSIHRFKSMRSAKAACNVFVLWSTFF